MNVALLVILVLAGADGNGLSFQAQVGYEPALLIRGNDYTYSVSMFPELVDVFYLSHTLSGKVGVQLSNNLGIRTTGSFSYSTIPYSKPNMLLPGPWLPSINTHWVSQEVTLGAEAIHPIGSRARISVFLGLGIIFGRLKGECPFRYHDYETDQTYQRTYYPESKTLGFQGRIGLNIPLISFGRFELQISPTLKGGALKEQSVEGVPDDGVWVGPLTLLKWGMALGLNLNYDGGKQ